MKKILRVTKALLLLAMVMTLSSISALTAHAQTIFPNMTLTEDGRIMVSPDKTIYTDSTGRKWCDAGIGYLYCYTTETRVVGVSPIFGDRIRTEHYLDSYLTDYIKSHDESEWPGFVIKGSDGVPFYFADYNKDDSNYAYDDENDPHHTKKCPYYVKYCYDEKTGWWLEDKAYKGPFVYTWTTEKPVEELIEETKTAIANGEEINGTPKKPVYSSMMDQVEDTEDRKPSNPDKPETPDKPVNPPTEGDEIKDPYADENTLGAAVTLSTDCIKVKKNNAAQKPLPKSVKVNNKALKRNKTFVVSYEKYDDGWHETDAVREEGTYRLVITGQKGYEGVYKKRLWVTADKTVKPMSSVAVKVNKIPYSGEYVTSGVIKSAKIGKRTLVEGTDYTVTYMNNLNSGTAQVKLTAIEGSGLLGTKTVNFTIKGNKMSGVKVKGLLGMSYDPENVMEQDIGSLELTYKDNWLNEGTDFTVSYVNNTKAGTAKIVFTGKGLYYGTLTKTFKINKVKVSDAMLDDASRSIVVERTGKALKPDVTIKNGNMTLVKGTDYTLAYKNNTKCSDKALITVKGKGNYTGSFKLYFKITDEIPSEDNKPSKDDKPVEDDKAGKDDKPVEDESPTEESEQDTSGEDSKPDDDTSGEDGKSDEDKKSDGDTSSEEDKSGDDTSGEEDKSDDDTSGEEDKSDEDKKSDGDTPGEEDKSDDDTSGEEDKSDEDTESKTAKPGVRVCWCGYKVNVSDFNNLSEKESRLWESHVSCHVAHDESTDYTDKYADGTESKGSETDNGAENDDSTENGDNAGTENGDGAETGDNTSTETGDNTGDGVETGEGTESGDDTETTERQRPIGYRICGCGYYMPVFTYGLSAEEKAHWSNHMNECVDGAKSHYSDCTAEKFEQLMGELKYEPGYVPN